MVNPLVDVIPVEARRYVYAAYALAALVVGALDVAGVELGPWDQVIAYLAVPFGALAASNARPIETQDDEATEPIEESEEP
jgi:lysophospholipid acyltransferase (LPLAT)-like uncharacterized protein